MTKGQRKALNLKVKKLKSTISSHQIVGSAESIVRKGTVHVSKSPVFPHVVKSPRGQIKKMTWMLVYACLCVSSLGWFRSSINVSIPTTRIGSV
jgi:hypothetical protein